METAIPPATTIAGEIRLASTGVAIGPATMPSADGSIHRPAWMGDRSSTDFRNCV
jgi:hypothetical protein